MTDPETPETPETQMTHLEDQHASGEISLDTYRHRAKKLYPPLDRTPRPWPEILLMLAGVVIIPASFLYLLAQIARWLG